MTACLEVRRRLRRPHLIVWLSAAALALGPTAVASAQTVQPRPLGRDLPVYQPPAGQARPLEPRPIEDPAGAITLRAALALALMQNPELAASAWAVRAQEARLLQAGRPPNPVVTSAVEDLGGGTGFTGVEDPIQKQATIELSQLVELGGKRAARRTLAASNRDLTAWDFETTRMDVLTRVTQAFVDVLASQRAVELADDTVGIVEAVRRAVALRVTAGVASPIEQTKADVAVAAVRIESNRARRALDADRQRLAALWGSTSPRFEAAVGDLTSPPRLPAFEELRARLSGSPDVARWVAELAQRQAALAVERAKRIPDVSVSGGYRRYPEIARGAFVLGASVALPLFDRNRGAVQEARDRLSQAQEAQRAAQVRVTALLADAYRALSSAADEASALEAAVLPGARAAFAAVEEGYRLGRFGYLDVLDAQRTLAAANGQHLRALAEYHKAVADVERLIGAPLNTTAPSPATSDRK